MKHLIYVFLLLLAACQSTDNPPPSSLYGDLYVRYLQDGEQIKAEASFIIESSDSTRTPYTVDGGVAFGGSGMGSRDLAGQIIRYQYENKSKYPESLNFQFKDQFGETRRFEATMPGIDSFAVATPLSTSKGGALELHPVGLSADQQLVLLFSDREGKAYTTTVNGPTGGKEVAIPAKSLAKMTPGEHQLYLVKKQYTETNEPYFKQVFAVEFYSNTIPVEIVE